MNTLDVACQVFGWQGGTIHEVYRRCAVISLNEFAMLQEALWQYRSDLTDWKTAVELINAYRRARHLDNRARLAELQASDPRVKRYLTSGEPTFWHCGDCYCLDVAYQGWVDCNDEEPGSESIGEDSERYRWCYGCEKAGNGGEKSSLELSPLSDLRLWSANLDLPAATEDSLCQ